MITLALMYIVLWFVFSIVFVIKNIVKIHKELNEYIKIIGREGAISAGDCLDDE